MQLHKEHKKKKETSPIDGGGGGMDGHVWKGFRLFVITDFFFGISVRS